MTDATAGDIRAAFDALRLGARTEPYPSFERRLGWLRSLREGVLAARADLITAIDADFQARAEEETLLAEVGPTLSTIAYCSKNLRRWMRPERRAVAWRFWFGSNRIYYQPLGVVGVLAPWNYPFNLAVVPMICALAAGNRVCVRPSSQTPRTSEVIARMVATSLPSDVATVLTGGRDIADAMLSLPFDQLTFTGSTNVGRDVMRAAAEHLTPVLLELGGRSPAIVHPDYDPAKAADRLAFGKFLNAGQTCIAPDHVFVHRDRRDALVEALRRTLEASWPNAAQNPSYSSVQSARRAERLDALLRDAEAKGARIVRIGAVDEARPARFPPTLALDASDGMRLAQEEIFGPILPIFTFDSIDAVFADLARKPRPLAAYYFDKDQGRIDRFLRETVSGGAAVNDAILHFAQEDLPFGGVGASGMGRYHAREGFKTYSNARAVYAPARFNLARWLHPPWTKRRRAMIDRMASR